MRTYGEVIEVRTADPVDVTDPSVPDVVRAVPEASVARPASPPSHVVAGAGAGAGAVAPAVAVGVPAQFLWRGRLYLVREVLAHWVELGTWWSARAPRTSSPRTPSSHAAPEVVGPRSVAADVGAVEREVWRVEAASGRTARVGVYDLVRDVPAARDPGATTAPPPARWRLARALD